MFYDHHYYASVVYETGRFRRIRPPGGGGDAGWYDIVITGSARTGRKVVVPAGPSDYRGRGISDENEIVSARARVFSRFSYRVSIIFIRFVSPSPFLYASPSLSRNVIKSP